MVKTCSHFVAKITSEDGPDPETELRYLFEQSRKSPEHVAWFASAYRGAKFDRAGNSICLIFRQIGDGPAIEAVVARILKREGAGLPSVHSAARGIYAQFAGRLGNWWLLGGLRPDKKLPDLALVTLGSVSEIPGQSWGTKKRSAAETFGGQTSASEWDFGEQFNTVDWIQELATRPA